MKIVLFTPNYPPEKGACAERVRHLAQYLQNKGHQLLVITALPNYPQGRIFENYRNFFFHTETIDNILVFRCWIFPSHAANLLLRFLAMCSLSLSVFLVLPRLRKFKPDLVFVQSPPLLLALSAYLLAKVNKAKFWLNISDLWPQALHDLGAIRKGWLYNRLENLAIFLYQKADYMTGQSAEIVAYVKQIVTKKHIILYRTGVDCEVFRQKEQKKYHLGEEKKTIKIVYAGLLGLAQGVLDLCKNINFAAIHAELHIFGDGFERQAIELEIQTALENKQVKGIFLYPACSQTEIAHLLPTFDAALVLQKASVFGTVPSKLYEAAACGLPLLFVGGGEGAKLVEMHQLGFVIKPQNFEDLQEKIKILRQLPENEVIAYGQNNSKIAQNMFDRHKILEEVYQSLEKI
jgi:glycosyltransferase involved in cell wall biosynthesis